jgi:hypothetical protein
VKLSEVIQKPIRKFLSPDAKLRANGLLDMLYTPAELAEELKINKRDVYSKLLPSGLPHSRDGAGHVWLHGPEIARWIRELKSGHKQLGDNEAYCLKCRRVVVMLEPRRTKQGKLTILKASCSACGTTINRGVKLR